MTHKSQILDMSRQNQQGQLSPWFDYLLDCDISLGRFIPETDFRHLADKLVGNLADYRTQANRNTVVLGMSGGVDSALTAALFKQAGWRVIGVTMPIHQVEAETQRGIHACHALGVEHLHVDLSAAYDHMVSTLASTGHDAALSGDDNHASIRRGNIRARMRMITLYNLASANHGLVPSTDNISELGAGFWTLHGDVGDLSPIQSLLKSWEVPMLAKLVGVPEEIWRATPTDGLGIVAGNDESQLGASYLEWDLMVFAIYDALHVAAHDRDAVRAALELDLRGQQVFDAVSRRMGATWFKRTGPINLPHPFEDRYRLIRSIDQKLFLPDVVQQVSASL